MLEGMRNKVKYALEDSQKMAGQIKEFSDSKLMQSVLNGHTFKYYYEGGRFHMLPQSYAFSRGNCLNSLFRVLLIVNQRDQVPPFRYINCDDDVYNLVRESKVLRDMKYFMRSVK